MAPGFLCPLRMVLAAKMKRQRDPSSIDLPEPGILDQRRERRPEMGGAGARAQPGSQDSAMELKTRSPCGPASRPAQDWPPGSLSPTEGSLGECRLESLPVEDKSLACDQQLGGGPALPGLPCCLCCRYWPTTAGKVTWMPCGSWRDAVGDSCHRSWECVPWALQVNPASWAFDVS